MSEQAKLQGKVVWHEIMSTNPKASAEFYTKLMGWNSEEMPMGESGKYTVFRRGEAWIGGVVPLDAAKKMPSHWMLYLATGDLEGVVKGAKEMKGTVYAEPQEVPEMGRFAVIGDPQGAMFCAWQSFKEPEGEEKRPGSGEFVWNELLTSDPANAGQFYAQLFDYGTKEMPMGEMGNYTLFQRGEIDRAGMMKLPPEAAAPPHWLCYLGVDDVDAATAKAQELGAKVCVPPRDIPNVGRFSVLTDSIGAVFALFAGGN